MCGLVLDHPLGLIVILYYDVSAKDVCMKLFKAKTY